ncbi:MAG: hypothetical protein KTR28_05780 [Micavibrio sp.]|nr:hypothetical protein [Micavibrio sp.]
MKQPIKITFQVFVWVAFFVFLPVGAFAQDSEYQARLELADEMLEINPPSRQVEQAVDAYLEAQDGVFMIEADKVRFKTAMIKILNANSLEQISRNAYADIFTLAELLAMVEYYSKPEAITARDKIPDLEGAIYPAIMKMMDQAIMKAKTAP